MSIPAASSWITSRPGFAELIWRPRALRCFRVNRLGLAHSPFVLFAIAFLDRHLAKRCPACDKVLSLSNGVKLLAGQAVAAKFMIDNARTRLRYGQVRANVSSAIACSDFVRGSSREIFN